MMNYYNVERYFGRTYNGIKLHFLPFCIMAKFYAKVALLLPKENFYAEDKFPTCKLYAPKNAYLLIIKGKFYADYLN